MSIVEYVIPECLLTVHVTYIEHTTTLFTPMGTITGQTETGHTRQTTEYTILGHNNRTNNNRTYKTHNRVYNSGTHYHENKRTLIHTHINTLFTLTCNKSTHGDTNTLTYKNTVDGTHIDEREVRWYYNVQ